MCRWAAYVGPKIFIEQIVTAPHQSLIAQSLHAREGKAETNGDGFGLAWYDERPEPGIYRDILPAWSDPNLRSLARQVRSGLFLAHVRASTGTATNRSNCHPFAVGSWCFMHNGQIGGYERLRRRLDMLLPEDLYHHRSGTTDSEIMFLLALSLGLEQDPAGALARMAGVVEDMAAALGQPPLLRFTAALSDGETLYAVRSASDAFAPTLYYRAGPADGVTVASEPLDAERADWLALAPGSFATVTASGVAVAPFKPLRAEARGAA
jgi:glutamine amidotransferase